MLKAKSGWPQAAAIASSLILGALSGAVAADLPETKIKAVGYISNVYIWNDLEKPFYAETLPEASNGAVTVDVQPTDQTGLRGPEVLRLLSQGTLQIAMGNISQMASDDPRFEGLDLAGLTLGNSDARKVVDAYRPVVARIMEEKFNVKLLALSQNPAQILWCGVPISGLADLASKKVRVVNPTMTDFVVGAGATPVSMPFIEVIPALQRGVADCAVTGAINGYTAKWQEVTSHLYPMNFGWGIVFWAANKDFWDGLTPEVQAFLEEQYQGLETNVWDAGAEMDKAGVACTTGGECEFGEPAQLTLVPLSADDTERHTSIVDDFVIKNWAQRCGAACAEEWNQTIGRVLGKTAPTSF